MLGHAQSTLISGMDKLEWKKMMPGVWKASFGETGLNALDYANPLKNEAVEIRQLFRAMVLERGYVAEEKLTGGELHCTENPYEELKKTEITDQYMLGPSILVVPVFTGQKERKVVLPKWNWYDFYTGEYVGYGEAITIKPGLNKYHFL